MNRNVKKTVYKILKEDEYARTDDHYLILKLVEELVPETKGETFINVMIGLKHKGISFESITRARRKFFEENPNLKDKITTQARQNEEENYILEYANHIPRLD